MKTVGVARCEPHLRFFKSLVIESLGNESLVIMTHHPSSNDTLGVGKGHKGFSTPQGSALLDAFDRSCDRRHWERAP